MADLLELAADLPERAVEPGEASLRAGERTGAVFIVVEGENEVRRGDVLLAVEDTPGICMGEMSMLLDQPHHATVVARTTGRVRVAADGLAFLRRDPEILVDVAKVLAHRLDLVNAYLVDLQEQYGGSAGHLGLVHEVVAGLASSRPGQIETGSEREPNPEY
jgi:CRP/FNR family cyclic AMP-dependent transcriptional regulator